MSVERSGKSKLEQSFESCADAFGLALANLTCEEYLYFLITLEDAEATKIVYH